MCGSLGVVGEVCVSLGVVGGVPMIGGAVLACISLVMMGVSVLAWEWWVRVCALEWWVGVC